MAVHLYTSDRVTTDVDAEFGARVFIPNDLIVDVTLEDGTREAVHFDTNYNSTFALMHEDYTDDAIPLDMGIEHIRLYVLSPLDLAVSKIARFADNDKGAPPGRFRKNTGRNARFLRLCCRHSLRPHEILGFLEVPSSRRIFRGG